MDETTLYSYSKIRRLGILFTSLSLLFFALCADYLIYPFFPNIAKKKGFSNTEIGVVYTAYNFARFLSSPITAWLVSILMSCYYLGIFRITEKWRWGPDNLAVFCSFSKGEGERKGCRSYKFLNHW